VTPAGTPAAVNQLGPGSAAAPRSSMLPPNIFDPRSDGSDYYWYVTNFVGGLAPGVSTNSQIQIDAGTDFYWIATTYFADLAGVDQEDSTRELPLITLLINDTGASRNLMNSPIPIPCIAGSGTEPYRLVRPRLFRANSVVNFTYTSYAVGGGDTYSNIYLTLHGYRRLVQAPGLVA
jgi:hypothetical protein